jgi:hypothetical protein
MQKSLSVPLPGFMIIVTVLVIVVITTTTTTTTNLGIKVIPVEPDSITTRTYFKLFAKMIK